MMNKQLKNKEKERDVMDVETIKRQLKSLRLNTAAKEIDEILSNQKKRFTLGG